ncbi:O-antigen ligase family protein [Nocardioides jishulii]|uniref:O-antigen ligase family protein n=1 Tax=Nocardioides jishulii TaxID=2575440 RepID=UPI0014851114|nr:O-antigen ligase family protein [Nocardioides jishulii]
MSAVFALAAFAPGHASRTGAFVAVAVILFQLAQGKKLDRLDGLAAAFITWLLVGSFFTEPTDASGDLFRDLVAGALIFTAIRLSVDSRRSANVVGGGLVLGCAYMALNLVPQVGDRPISQLELASDTLRYTFEGLNSNHVAYSVASACFVLLAVVIDDQSRGKFVKCVTFAMGAALFYFGVLPPGTRGGLIATVGMAALIPLVRLFGGKATKLRLRLFAALVLLASVGLSAGLLERLIQGRLAVSDREDGTLNGRLEMWPRALASIRESPIFGKGPGASLDINNGISFHNALLDITVDLGLIGVSIWTALIVLSLRALQGNSSRIRLSMVAGTLLLTVILLSGYWHPSPTLWAVVGFMTTLGPGGRAFPSERQEEEHVPTADERVSSVRRRRY